MHHVLQSKIDIKSFIEMFVTNNNRNVQASCDVTHSTDYTGI